MIKIKILNIRLKEKQIQIVKIWSLKNICTKGNLQLLKILK